MPKFLISTSSNQIVLFYNNEYTHSRAHAQTHAVNSPATNKKMVHDKSLKRYTMVYCNLLRYITSVFNCFFLALGLFLLFSVHSMCVRMIVWFIFFCSFQLYISHIFHLGRNMNPLNQHWCLRVPSRFPVITPSMYECVLYSFRFSVKSNVIDMLINCYTNTIYLSILIYTDYTVIYR